MTEVLNLARQYILNELSLPDEISSIEAIHLTQQLRQSLLNGEYLSNSDLIDAIYNIRKACADYEAKHKRETSNELANVLKINNACTKFLIEADKNTYFWHRHKSKIIIGVCLVCVVIGIILIATGVGSPLALFLGLFGIQLTIELPALVALSSVFCFLAGLIISGILIGLHKLISFCCISPEGASSEVKNLGKSNSLDGSPGLGSLSSHQLNIESEFSSVYEALYNAAIPVVCATSSASDYLVLKRGLTYRLENTYGYGATPYYVIRELEAAKSIMDKDFRFERLCAICGVAVARVDKEVWEKFRKQYEYSASKNDIAKIKPIILGLATQFVMVEGKDPAEILELSRYAGPAEIRKAFKRVLENSLNKKFEESNTEKAQALDFKRFINLITKDTQQKKVVHLNRNRNGSPYSSDVDEKEEMPVYNN